MQKTIKKNILSLPSPMIIGYLTMTLVLFIWSGFSLTVRAIGTSPLTIADVALIRFSVPLILLMPFIPKHIEAIKKVKILDMLFILLGGIPFLFFASLGAKTVPSAYVGTIIAGTPALFIALLSYLFYAQKIPRTRFLALSIIFIGVITMIIGSATDLSINMLKGIALLICASIVWAGYTLALKRAKLDALTVAIILSYLSFFIMLGLTLAGVFASNLGSFSVQQAMPFILVQGLGVGFLATIGFSYAVNQLGSVRTSIIGSLSPGVTALLAIPIFNEPLSITILFGISLIMTGVILSNRD